MFLTGDHNLGGDANPPQTAYCYMSGPTMTAGVGFAIWLGTNWVSNQGPAFLAISTISKATSGWRTAACRASAAQFQNAMRNTGDTGRAPGTGFKPATGVGPSPGPGCNRIQLP